MSRADHEVRPTGGRGTERHPLFGGIAWRHLDLIHNGATFLRRRGVELFGAGVLVHRIDAPDPGLDLHDHPWPFITIILRGGYTEEWAEVISRDAADRLTCPGCGCAMCSHGTRGCRWHVAQCTAAGLAPSDYRTWPRWSVHRMPLGVAHRITECEPNTVSLVIRGRKVRRWGFFLPTGWVDWEAYDYDARRPVSVASNHAEEVR